MTYDTKLLAIVEAAVHACWIGLIDTAAFTMFVWLMIALVRPSASARHILWWTVLVVATGVPIASFGGSLARIHGVAGSSVERSRPSSRSQMSAALTQRTDADGTPAHVSMTPMQRAVGNSPRSNLSMFQHVVRDALPSVAFAAAIAGAAIWFFVALFKMRRLGADLATLGRVKRRAVALDSVASASLTQWQRLVLKGRRAAVATSQEIAVPCAAGLRRPTILFPLALATSARAEDLDRIALHEYAHLVRFDDWTQLAERIVGAALWFHPAVAIARQRIALEREVACDDWVVARTGTPHGYASCLLRLAEAVHDRQRLQSALGALGGRHGITQRIAHLTSESGTAARGSRITVVAVSIVALGIAVTQTLRAPAIAYASDVQPRVSTSVPHAAVARATREHILAEPVFRRFIIVRPARQVERPREITSIDRPATIVFERVVADANDTSMHAPSGQIAHDARALASDALRKSAVARTAAKAAARAAEAQACTEEAVANAAMKRAREHERDARSAAQKANDAELRVLAHARIDETRAELIANDARMRAALAADAERRETELHRDMEHLREELRREPFPQPPDLLRGETGRNNPQRALYMVTTSEQGGS